MMVLDLDLASKCPRRIIEKKGFAFLIGGKFALGIRLCCKMLLRMSQQHQ